MTLPTDFGHLQREILRILKYGPWLPLAAIVGEAIQHFVETKFGMYVRGDGIQAGHEENVRMMAIAIKVIGFITTILFTTQLVHRLQRSERLVLAPIRRSIVALAILIPILCHYALNYRAVGKSPIMVDAMVGVDAVVIGWLAMTLAIVLPRSRQ